jgi:hypothetical protein
VHLFGGAEFQLTWGEDRVRLSHAEWPVQGEGATLLEAEQALIGSARALAKTYLSRPLSEQDEGLRSFLFDTI